MNSPCHTEIVIEDEVCETLPEGNGYMEIISYDKLLRDAKRRNRVLFDKLGLHKH